MRVSVVAVVVAVLSCSGGRSTSPATPAAWQLPADPTMGICADGQTAVQGPAALLEAAAEALRRGCLKEALIDATAVRASGDTNQQASATLLIVEAGQGVVGRTLIGDGGMSIVGNPSWLAPYAELDMTKSIPVLAKAIEDGSLAPAARDDGRLLHVVVRFAPMLQCLPTVAAMNRDGGVELHQQIVAHAATAFRRQIVPGESGGGLAAAATSALWQCDLEGAAAAFARAAAAERRAGRKDTALAFALQAWEARELPGGRAAHFGTGLPAPIDEMVRHARDLEAAPHGGGEAAAIGTRASAALDALVREAGVDENAEPMVLWLRAVLAQRFLGRPADAVTFATRAEARAIAMRRADLADAARVVGALAAAELGRYEDTRRLLALAFASAGRRGALGTIQWIAAATQVFVTELQRRGRPADAIALVTAARDGIGDLAPDMAFALSGLAARALLEAGRTEDALAEYERILAKPSTASMADLTMRKMANEAIERLREELGYEVPIPDAGDSPGARAVVALEKGDLGPLNELLADRPIGFFGLALVGHLCAAAPDDIADAATEVAEVIAEQTRTGVASAKNPDEVEAFAGDLMTLSSQMSQVAEAVMHCGARTRNVNVFRAGQQLAKVTLGANENADALEAEATGKLELAASKWEALGRSYANTIDEVGAVGTAKRSGDLLETAALTYLATGTKLERAVALLEEARSRSLRAARAARQTANQDPAVADLVAVERALAQQVTRARALAKLAKDATGGTQAALAKAVASTDGELKKLEGKRDAIARRMRTADPRAYQAAALSAPPALRDIQAKLETDEVLVYYVITPLDAWAVVVDRTRARAIALPNRDGNRLPRVDPALRRYRVHVRGASEGRALRRVASRTANLTGPRAELYQLLVAPLEPVIPPNARVIIIPDEHTADVAFAELGTAARPWIERNPIRVLPNARLLFDTSTGKLDKKRAVVLGDPDFTGAAQWEQLPATRAEAVGIAQRLGVTPLLGDDANERRLRGTMERASLLHFATHGFADIARPSYSMVVLSHRTSAPSHDGLLYAYEIERMHLDARLVVLSACETGRGIARGTEGMLALDRAFLVAGAGAVISSLWVVPDESTSALMIELYRELDAGKPADVALALAMRAVRKQSKWADPQFWSAFRVVGAGLR